MFIHMYCITADCITTFFYFKKAVCEMYVEHLVACLLQISKSLGGGAKRTIS